MVDIVGDDFVLQDPIVTRQITLEDAVSHRTGMARHEVSYGKQGATTVRGVTRNLRNLPLHHPLRAEFEYCNTMYVAATHALETVTGKDFSQVVRESLWEPLGMGHTYAGFGEAISAVEKKGEVLAKGYTWSKLPGDPEEDEGELGEEEWLDFPEVSGAGYVISTANDYAKWMRCLLSSSAPLSEAMTKELWSSRSIVPLDDSFCVPFDGGLVTYALGWFPASYRGYRVLFHSGGLTGAGSYVMLAPDLKWGVAFFINGHDGCPKLSGLAFELLDEVLGTPGKDRNGMKRIEERTLQEYKEMATNYINARKTLYPSAPGVPNVPLSLPFEKYAGSYQNLGYGPVTLAVQDGEKGAKNLCFQWQRSWPTKFWLEHVNADYWLLIRSLHTSPLRTVMKVESKIGPDGEVAGFYMAMEPTMPETMMWFERQS